MRVFESRAIIASSKYGAMALAVLATAITLKPNTASALPAFARQTGQPCATCHLAFPELTPYGRQFKLGGYTYGGTRCNDGGMAAYLREGQGGEGNKGTQIPIAVMVNPTYTHTRKDQAPDKWLLANDNVLVQETSIFVAGQLFCNLGAFTQATFAGADNVFAWDNADIRYANTANVRGVDVLYGVTVNNSPTVQDVWNTTPVWSFPFTGADVARGPSAATMIEGTFGQRVAGAGSYVWLNRMLYAEFSAYRSLDSRTLTTFGADPTDGSPRIDGFAPYWRLAFEKTWDQNSLMFGTFGMIADLKPTVEGEPHGTLAYPGTTDRFTDVGIDTQYQYINETHAFSVRGTYIWEKQKLNGEYGDHSADNKTDHLYSFKASAGYTYDRTVSFTVGYFDLKGTRDASHWDFSQNGSPNSNGWTADIAYLPYSHGGPSAWPWLNARIGVTYTHNNKLDGLTNNYDGAGRNARDDDSTYVYTWFAF